jgi:choline-sulfatase
MQLDYDEEVFYRAIQKLYDFARDPEQKPFFLCVSFTHPHDPYVTTPEYWNRYDHDDIDMPEIGLIPDEELDSFSKRLLHHYGVEQGPVSDDQVRNARHAYYGSVSYIDDKVGAMMDVLEKTKFGDNTVVIFTADHGDMLGERGMWYKKAFFDWSARVPLFFHAPKLFKSRRVDAVTSLVDLCPTLVELAKGKQSDIVGPVDGNSLCDLLKGDGVQWSDTAYSEMLAEGVDAPHIMIRRGRYKLIYCPGGSPVIFDMEKDPQELENLAGSSEASDIEAAFIQEIESKWDIADLTARIITSQKQRRFILESLSFGEPSPWDYQPVADASKRFIRTSEKWTDIEARYLLPGSTA